MNLRKALLIALKDVYILFSDRAGLIITLAAPIVLTFVIAAAFSQLSSGAGAPIRDIPLVVVNQDTGVNLMGQQVNFGAQLTDVLVNSPDGLDELLAGRELNDPAAARQEVRNGTARAAVIIPADFSQSLNPTRADLGKTPVTVEVFRDTGAIIASDIVTSVVRQIVNGFAASSIAGAATGQVAFSGDPALMMQISAVAQEVGQRANQSPPLGITTLQSGETGSGGLGFNLVQYFAPSMAVFFMTFTMSFGIISIMDERIAWTLQRMVVSPTSRMTILSGKLMGAFLNGVLQMLILIAATSVLGPALGSIAPWGTNIPGLLIFVVVSVLAAMGLGALLVGLAKDRTQAVVISNAVLILLGLIGGSFFSSNGPPLGPISQLSLNYWATSGFFDLSRTSVLPMTNVIALLIFFAVTFTVGIVLFNRRLDI